MDYLQEGNDWPRHHDYDSEREHTLGVWIHTQRYKRRRGQSLPSWMKLFPAGREGAPWAALPGREQDGVPPGQANDKDVAPASRIGVVLQSPQLGEPGASALESPDSRGGFPHTPGRNPGCCQRAVTSDTRPGESVSGGRHGAADSCGRAAGKRREAFRGRVWDQLQSSGRCFEHGEREFAMN
ncbi:hypothetical protein ACFDR8_003101 [Arthrobacter sp. MP_2.3]